MNKLFAVILILALALSCAAYAESPACTEEVISIHTDRATTYEAYFRMQNAIVAAYAQLREAYARERYGKGYGELVDEQRDEVNQYSPPRISESKPTTEGGES